MDRETIIGSAQFYGTLALELFNRPQTGRDGWQPRVSKVQQYGYIAHYAELAAHQTHIAFPWLAEDESRQDAGDMLWTGETESRADRIACYIKAIRNPRKKVYAQRWYLYLQHGGQQPASDISVMASQAVRAQLHRLYYE